MQAQLLSSGTTAFFNYGATVPAVNNRGFPWIRNAGDAFDDTYNFLMGYWLAVYKAAPAGPNGVRWDYEDTEASLFTFEGGENAPVTLVAGPYWEIDHNYDGRSSMGPGVIDNANPAKTLSVGENYGTGSVLATSDNVPPHTHPFQRTDTNILNGANVKTVIPGAGGAGLQIGLTGTAQDDLSIGANTFTSAQEAIPTISPVRGAYKIKRTGRMYRRLGP
jgi:hypothetical protein